MVFREEIEKKNMVMKPGDGLEISSWLCCWAIDSFISLLWPWFEYSIRRVSIGQLSYFYN